MSRDDTKPPPADAVLADDAERELARRFNWWWRDGGKALLGSSEWNAYRLIRRSCSWLEYEPWAWFYEAEKRFGDGYLFGEPFHRLTQRQISKGRTFFGDASQRSPGAPVVDLKELEAGPEGFANGELSAPAWVQFDLRRTDTELREKLEHWFRDWLSVERKRKKMPNPGRHPGKRIGRRTRDYPWRGLEIADRHAGGEVLLDKEHSAKHEAKQRWEQQLPTLRLMRQSFASAVARGETL